MLVLNPTVLVLDQPVSSASTNTISFSTSTIGRQNAQHQKDFPTPTGCNMAACSTPSGLLRRFHMLTRGALRDPGLCCWTASQSPEQSPPTPARFNIIAQARVAHPGITGTRYASPPAGFNVAACSTPSGLLRRFHMLTRGALRDPGLCCWTASQSPEQSPPTPTGCNIKAQGREAHPGKTGTRYARTPAGFNMAACVTHSEYRRGTRIPTRDTAFVRPSACGSMNAKSHKLFGLVALGWSNSFLSYEC